MWSKHKYVGFRYIEFSVTHALLNEQIRKSHITGNVVWDFFYRIGKYVLFDKKTLRFGRRKAMERLQ